MKNKLNNLYWYSLLTILIMIIFCLIYKPWQLTLTTPFDYRIGDEYSALALFKGIKDVFRKTHT